MVRTELMAHAVLLVRRMLLMPLVVALLRHSIIKKLAFFFIITLSSLVPLTDTKIWFQLFQRERKKSTNLPIFLIKS